MTSLEAIESTFSHNFQHQDWYDQLYSPGYWPIRAMTPDTTRPMPLLRSESDRILRWLDDIEGELKRINEPDEWNDKNIPRLILDTSAIVREGEFDTFNWEPIVNNVCGNHSPGQAAASGAGGIQGSPLKSRTRASRAGTWLLRVVDR